VGTPRKYATEEERRQGQLEWARAYKKRRLAEFRATNPPKKSGPKSKYASPEDAKAAQKQQMREFAIRNRENVKAIYAATKAAERTRIAIFARDVPAILNSRPRTRLFICLVEYGPMTIYDVAKYVGRTNTRTRFDMIGLLEDQGIVVQVRISSNQVVFYLNPGHPAYTELFAFGRRLAEVWPSPPRKPAKVEQKPMPMPRPLTCNLFGYEQRNRALLLVAVTGGIDAQRVITMTGILNQAGAASKTLKTLVASGMLKRLGAPPKGQRRTGNQPKKFVLDTDYFAYPELRALLLALATKLYPEIVGYACSIGRHDPAIAAHVEAL
jgi:hypothetical protein